MTYVAVRCIILLRCFGTNSVRCSAAGAAQMTAKKGPGFTVTSFAISTQIHGGQKIRQLVIFPNYSPILGTVSAKHSPVQGRGSYNAVILRKVQRRDYCYDLTRSR